MDPSMSQPSHATLLAAWQGSPCGMVAIGLDGLVCAVNQSFAQCTSMAAPGSSEAELRLVQGVLHDYQSQRIGLDGHDSLSALYYFMPKPHNDPGMLALREPLTSLYGFIELLYTQDYDEQTRHQLLLVLLEQVEAMANIFNEHDSRP